MRSAQQPTSIFSSAATTGRISDTNPYAREQSTQSGVKRSVVCETGDTAPNAFGDRIDDVHKYRFGQSSEVRYRALLWWDYLEGGSKSMADCLDFDENFELGKI
jgi:hypothetical protein